MNRSLTNLRKSYVLQCYVLKYTVVIVLQIPDLLVCSICSFLIIVYLFSWFPCHSPSLLFDLLRHFKIEYCILFNFMENTIKKIIV